MRLYAFQGLRFSLDAHEIDPLVAPAYDQINDQLRDELHARSPHHFSHLTKPVAGEAGDPYKESTRLHESWKDSGLVQRDEAPALYPYAIDLVDGGRRLGICCMAGVEDPSSGVIRAHEATLDKPLADRVALLKANRVDLEPILFLSDDQGTLDALLEEDMAATQPVAVHTDETGNLHKLFRVEAPERIAAYRDLFAPLSMAIADGHHRYKTARRFAAEVEAAEGTAEAAKMTVVTSLSSSGLAIDPIHRCLRAVPDLEAMASRTLSRETVDVSDGPRFAAAVDAAPAPALGVWVSGQAPEIWHLDASQAPDTIPSGARDLPVALLHGSLLAAAGFAPESATDGTVVYRSDPAILGKELAEGSLAIGLFLPTMSPQAFAKAIEDGDLLPPKSTRFLPKVYSGLVWADHDSKLA